MNWQQVPNTRELELYIGFLRYTISSKSWKCDCKLADGSFGLVKAGRARSRPDAGKKADLHFFSNILPNMVVTEDKG